MEDFFLKKIFASGLVHVLYKAFIAFIYSTYIVHLLHKGTIESMFGTRVGLP